MEILFDLQDYLEKVQTGAKLPSRLLSPYGEPPPEIEVLEHDGVKYISVSGRTQNYSGVSLRLQGLPGLEAGYRIVITGRIDKSAPKDGWGIALSEGTGSHEAQLAQQLNPSGIYSLAYVFDREHCRDTLFIHTTSWREYLPKMDFTIDGILISDFTRPSVVENVQDKRGMVYSMAGDQDIQSLKDGALLPENMRFLRRSGTPRWTAADAGGKRGVRLSGRSKDYDGFDIRMEELGLIQNNEYTVKCFGAVEGKVEQGAQITFQILPGFSWRSAQEVTDGGSFDLAYTIGKYAAGKLTDLRVTTNLAGAKADIFVRGIEITAGGHG